MASKCNPLKLNSLLSDFVLSSSPLYLYKYLPILFGITYAQTKYLTTITYECALLAGPGDGGLESAGAGRVTLAQDHEVGPRQPGPGVLRTHGRRFALGREHGQRVDAGCRPHTDIDNDQHQLCFLNSVVSICLAMKTYARLMVILLTCVWRRGCSGGCRGLWARGPGR